jgi:hypothetical protein
VALVMGVRLTPSADTNLPEVEAREAYCGISNGSLIQFSNERSNNLVFDLNFLVR